MAALLFLLFLFPHHMPMKPSLTLWASHSESIWKRRVGNEWLLPSPGSLWCRSANLKFYSALILSGEFIQNADPRPYTSRLWIRESGPGQNSAKHPEVILMQVVPDCTLRNTAPSIRGLLSQLLPETPPLYEWFIKLLLIPEDPMPIYLPLTSPTPPSGHSSLFPISGVPETSNFQTAGSAYE